MQEVPNFAGVKFTDHNLYLFGQLIDRSGGGINAVSGPDEMALPAMVMGADAAIGTTYNIMPKIFLKMRRDFDAGDLPAAQACQQQANRVIRLLLEVGALPGVKQVLRGPRHPGGADADRSASGRLREDRRCGPVSNSWTSTSAETTPGPLTARLPEVLACRRNSPDNRILRTARTAGRRRDRRRPGSRWNFELEDKVADAGSSKQVTVPGLVEVVAAQVAPPPGWALLERRLMALMEDAAAPMVDKYAEKGGAFYFADDVDDLYERVYNWGLFYAMGADRKVLDLALQQWNATTRFFADDIVSRVHPRFCPQIHNEYYNQGSPGANEWHHQGEGNMAFYHFGLADPTISENVRRARRFAAMFINEDPEAPNYNPRHKVFRSPIQTSVGPMRRASAGNAIMWLQGGYTEHRGVIPLLRGEGQFVPGGRGPGAGLVRKPRTPGRDPRAVRRHRPQRRRRQQPGRHRPWSPTLTCTPARRSTGSGCWSIRKPGWNGCGATAASCPTTSDRRAGSAKTAGASGGAGSTAGTASSATT